MWFFVLVSDFADDPGAAPTYVALGNAVSSLTYSAVYGVTMSAGAEKHIGTMATIMSTPTRMFYVFLGKGAYQSIIGLFTVTVSLAFASSFFGVNSGSGPWPWRWCCCPPASPWSASAWSSAAWAFICARP